MKLPNIPTFVTTVVLLTLGAAPAVSFAAPREGGKSETQEGSGSSALRPLASVLQVTGTTNNFTVSAQHADVLSLLKLVFDQAHRQFVPDGSVTGDVTFSLTGQRFDLVLASICKQAILRYEIDRNGVYQFHRDDEALRNLILKTQAINSVLQEQLRRMGYTVPGGMTQQGGGSGFGGGGAPGRIGQVGGPGSLPDGAPSNQAAPGGSANPGRSFQNRDAKDQAARVLQPNSPLQSDRALSGNSAGRPEGQAGPKGDSGPSGERGPRGSQGPIGQTYAQINSQGHVGQENGGAPNLEDVSQYQMYIKQNSLVSIDTHGEDMGVREALLAIGRQAGVSILIDPAVPKGTEFVINGHIPPRPLTEFLNILSYRAHLDWRCINNRIFVTSTPQLQIYLRKGALPPPNGGITVLPQTGRSAPAGEKSVDKADKKVDDKPGQTEKDKP